MSGTTTPYEVGRRTGRCAATGRELKPGDEYVAALVEAPANAPGGDSGAPPTSDGLVRMDFSREGWESSPRPRGLFAFWRARMADGNEKKHRLIDDAALLELFEQLAGATEPKRVAFRYVLALILVRKRVLVSVDSVPGEKGGPGIFIVSERATGPGSKERQPAMPRIEVVDPALDSQTIGEVTEQLEEVLKEGA